MQNHLTTLIKLFEQHTFLPSRLQYASMCFLFPLCGYELAYKLLSNDYATNQSRWERNLQHESSSQHTFHTTSLGNPNP